jgi:hypothetical protein
MYTPQSVGEIEQNAAQYGATPAAKAMMRREAAAAEDAIASGWYMTWRPTEEFDRSGTRICARIGRKSGCLCGHSFEQHQQVPKNKKGFICPPKCASCSCREFRYAPSRPEEVGMWHLPRRKDFDLKWWQARVRERPTEYCCIGCDRLVTEHEVFIETEAERREKGLAVGRAYMPLSESPMLQDMILGNGEEKKGEPSLEEQFERGQISAAEYHKRSVQDMASKSNCGSMSSPRDNQNGGSDAVARAGPRNVTVHAVRMRDGREAVAMTNALSKPMPVQGKNWMRERPSAGGGAGAGGGNRGKATMGSGRARLMMMNAQGEGKEGDGGEHK